MTKGSKASVLASRSSVRIEPAALLTEYVPDAIAANVVIHLSHSTLFAKANVEVVLQVR